MIDLDRKFIFIHITKTGGTSVERALGGKLHDHRACKKYIEKYGKNIFDRFSSFSIVRNPWDKMVSHYCYLRLHKKSNENGPLDTRVAAMIKDLSFNEWIERVGSGVRAAAFSLRHFDYLKVDGKMKVKNIIRFENLQEDFNEVCLKIGIEAVKLPHLNKSNHAHYPVYYNDRTRKIVRDYFKDEIEYFGYSYD